jgi:hypothetical protein
VLLEQLLTLLLRNIYQRFQRIMLDDSPNQNGWAVIFRANGGPEIAIYNMILPQKRHVREGILVVFGTRRTPFTKEQAVTQTGAELEGANTQATSGDAVSETEAYGRARAQGDDAIERSCMVCGNKFESEGWHNRLCGSCRKRSVAAG